METVPITIKLVFSSPDCQCSLSFPMFPSPLFLADDITPIPGKSPIPVLAVKKKLEGFGIFLGFNVFASSYNLVCIMLDLKRKGFVSLYSE